MNKTEEGNQSEQSEATRLHFFNDFTYIDCGAHFADCSVLKNVGAVFSLVLLPSVTFGLIGNVLLILISLFARRKGVNKEYTVIKVAFLMIELFFIVSNVLVINFTKYGLPWLDYDGYFVDSKAFGCKLSAFFKLFSQSLFSNLMLCQTLFMLSGYFLTTVNRKTCVPLIYGLMMTAVISCIHASPAVILNNVWQFRKPYTLCAGDPRWPRALIYWSEIHYILFCEGLLQCLVIVPLLSFILLAYSNYSRAMQVMSSFSNSSSRITNHSLLQRIQEKMNEQQKDVIITSVKFLLLSLIKICRAGVRASIFQETYIAANNKDALKDVYDLYVSVPLLDFFQFVMVLTIVTFTWIDLLRDNFFPKLLIIMGCSARFYKSCVRRLFLLDEYYQEIEETELVLILKSSLSPRKLELVQKEKECYMHELYYRNLHDETPVLHARK